MQSYGAADTPDNANRIRNHYASDPTAMDRRLTGARGQSYEGGADRDAILNAMLDKAIAQTAAPTAPPDVLPVSPMVQNATGSSRRSATAGTPPQLSRDVPGAAIYDQRNLGPLPPRDSTSPSARGPSGYEVDPQQSAQSGTGTLDGMEGLLPILLGLFGAGAAARAGTGRSAPPAALGSKTSPIPPSTTPAPPLGTQTMPADVARVTDQPSPYRGTEGDVQGFPPPQQKDTAPSASQRGAAQSEMDAANVEGEAIQREMAKQASGKKFTPKNAVRNATGRK